MLLQDLLAGKLASSSLQDQRVLAVEDDYLIAQDLPEELLRCNAEVMGPVASVAHI